MITLGGKKRLGRSFNISAWSLCLLTGSVMSSLSSSSYSSAHAVTLSGGLINLGNTCYMNSQLQCSFHIPRVRQLIASSSFPSREEEEERGEKGEREREEGEEKKEGKEESGSSSSGISIALMALRKVFEEMETNPNASVTPRILCQSLGIPVMVQQDSQEFWKLLLPELGLPALTDLYQGSFEDYISALDGSDRERKREEPFLDLSLDVSSDSVVESLQKMFGAPELLSEVEGNGWRPEKGADKIDALKGSVLHAQGLPSILQFHLKRFQYDWNTDTTSKINRRFTFPEELDLSSVCSQSELPSSQAPPRSSLIYDLQSVVVHLGEYDSGHYYSYVRPDFNAPDVWYRFNDQVVTQVTFKEVIDDSFGGGRGQKGIIGFGRSGWGGKKSNAYVLQYVRRSDIPMLYDCT